MLRIATGFYKGRVLRAGSNPEIRPTMAKLKLSFFDIVQDQIREKIFLDGFAGTGNIGIEALSRGAEYVVFIDHLPEAARMIKHNLEKIGIPPDKYRVVEGDFNRSVIQLAHDGMKFDFIFLDPPYDLLRMANPLKVIYKRGILAANGTVVLEKREDIRFDGKYFQLQRSRKIGREALEFYTLAPTE